MENRYANPMTHGRSGIKKLALRIGCPSPINRSTQVSAGAPPRRTDQGVAEVRSSVGAAPTFFLIDSIALTAEAFCT